jgi:hypothetical protein
MPAAQPAPAAGPAGDSLAAQPPPRAGTPPRGWAPPPLAEKTSGEKFAEFAKAHAAQAIILVVMVIISVYLYKKLDPFAEKPAEVAAAKPDEKKTDRKSVV